jgi:hypothetical protein
MMELPWAIADNDLETVSVLDNLHISANIELCYGLSPRRRHRK